MCSTYNCLPNANGFWHAYSKALSCMQISHAPNCWLRRTCSKELVIRWHSPSHSSLTESPPPPRYWHWSPSTVYWDEKEKGRCRLPLHVEAKDWSNCPLPSWCWLTKKKYCHWTGLTRNLYFEVPLSRLGRPELDKEQGKEQIWQCIFLNLPLGPGGGQDLFSSLM